MQVLFGAFQPTTISKNTHSHVSRTLKIFVQLKKQISYRRNMCLANNTTVVVRLHCNSAHVLDYYLENKSLPWDYQFKFVIDEISNVNDKTQVCLKSEGLPETIYHLSCFSR